MCAAVVMYIAIFHSLPRGDPHGLQFNRFVKLHSSLHRSNSFLLAVHFINYAKLGFLARVSVSLAHPCSGRLLYANAVMVPLAVSLLRRFCTNQTRLKLFSGGGDCSWCSAGLPSCLPRV